MNNIMKILVLLVLWTGASYGQIKWEHITGSPYSIGATAPATCTVGDVFFKTNATAGQNIYGCTTSNVWTVVSGAVLSVNGVTGAITLGIGSDGIAPAWSGGTLNIPSAGTTSVTAGTISKTEYDTFNAKQAALGFTPENVANKGAMSGYASLDGSTKVPIGQIPTGTTSSTVAIGDDSRLSDARTPTAHTASHGVLGSDPVAIAQSQVADLTTDLSGKAATSHEHNASTDLTSGEVPAARGGLGADASAYTGFLRMSSGTPSASDIVTADLPAVIDFSGKTSTTPAKIGTLAPASCRVGETFFDTDATAGENWLLCTSTNTWTAVVGGGGGSLTTYSVASFTASFTSQTSVSLTHNFGSTKQIIACYDGSNVFLEPSSITIGGLSSTVTFATAQTGSCTVIGGTGLYEESFTGQTSVNLDHDYNTTAIMVRCYDGSEVEVLPSSVTATDVNNATVTFANAQTGRCSVAATLATGAGGGSGTVTSVGLTGVSGILSVASSPVTTSGTMALSLDSQTAYKFLSTGASTEVPSFQSIPVAALPTVSLAKGGTNQTSWTAGRCVQVSADGTQLEVAAAACGTGGSSTGDVTMIQATATLSSWGAITAAGTSGSCVRKNITLAGAVAGDVVNVGPPSDIEVGLKWDGLAGTDVAIVQLCNNTGASITPADGRTFRVQVNRSTL